MRSLIPEADPTERAWRQATLSLEPFRAGDCAGHWHCDLESDSLTWSPQIFTLFGLDRDSRLDRRDILEMYEPESRMLMERLRARAIAERGSFTMEAKIRRADGAARWMLLTADVACRDGRVTQLYGMKQDITPAMTGQ